MTQLAYTRYELLRTFRNKRFFFLALGFPVVLYFLIAGPNRNENDLAHTGLSAPLYYMVGLAAFGTMNAMLSAGARIAAERAAGWNRQLRITPLSVRAYFRTKVLTGYMMAVTVLVSLYISGIILGVSLSGREWWRMTLLIVIGLIPFAALGVVLGHLATPDSIGPIMGGSTALLALLGGTWFPITGGVMQTDRRAAAVVLAGPGKPRRARRSRLEHEGVDRDRRLDGRPDRARTPLLPARHQARLSRGASSPPWPCRARARATTPPARVPSHRPT